MTDTSKQIAYNYLVCCVPPCAKDARLRKDACAEAHFNASFTTVLISSILESFNVAYRFFACKWIINFSMNNLDDFFDTLNMFNSRLATMFTGNTLNGYHYYDVFLAVDSQNTFKLIQEKFTNNYNAIDWEEVTEYEFNRANEVRLKQVDRDRIHYCIKEIWNIYKWEYELKKRLNSEWQNYLAVSFLWLINHKELKQSFKVYGLDKNHDSLFHIGTTDSNGFHYLQYFYVAPSKDDIKEFIQQIRQLLTIRNIKHIALDEIPNILFVDIHRQYPSNISSKLPESIAHRALENDKRLGKNELNDTK